MCVVCTEKQIGQLYLSGTLFVSCLFAQYRKLNSSAAQQAWGPYALVWVERVRSEVTYAQVVLVGFLSRLPLEFHGGLLDMLSGYKSSKSPRHSKLYSNRFILYSTMCTLSSSSSSCSSSTASSMTAKERGVGGGSWTRNSFAAATSCFVVAGRSVCGGGGGGDIGCERRCVPK